MGLLFSIKRAIRSIQMCLIFSFWFGCGLYGRVYDYKTPTARYLRDIEISELDSGMAGIDCIYVINLDDRPQKWGVVKDILNGLGLRANRVSAVNGWELTMAEKLELLGPYATKAPMRGGQIGCLLSHISVIKDAYNRGFKKIWILEDDICFNESPHILPDLLEELTEFDPNWDVFYTDRDFLHRSVRKMSRESAPGYFRPDQKYPLGVFYTRTWQVSPNIFRIRYRFGMHSVLISRKGIEKILHYFTHTYIYSPIDHDIHHIPSIKEYAYNREMTYTNLETSDSYVPLSERNP